MNCQIVQNKLQQYLTKQLSARDENLVRLHLDKCDNCQQELSQWEEFFVSLKTSTTEYKLPEDFTAQVMNQIDIVEEKMKWHLKLPPIFYQPAIVSLAASIIFSLFLWPLVSNRLPVRTLLTFATNELSYSLNIFQTNLVRGVMEVAIDLQHVLLNVFIRR